MQNNVKFNIKEACEEDIPALVILENQTFTTDQLDAKNFKNFIKKKSSAVFVAKDGRHIIGNIILLFRKNSKRARIYSLLVEAAYRKFGIAAQLLKTCEILAIEKKCKEIVLEVREDNLGAIAFYHKNGYEIFGKYVNFYQDNTDGLRMIKKLNV